MREQAESSNVAEDAVAELRAMLSGALERADTAGLSMTAIHIATAIDSLPSGDS